MADESPVTAPTAATESAPEAPAAAPAPAKVDDIREAFRAYQAKRRGGKAESEPETTDEPEADAQAAPPAEETPAADPVKPDAKAEILARIREGRKLAQEKLELARTKQEIEAARKDISFAKEVRDAVVGGDYVRLFELTGGDFKRAIENYATHGRELTAEERLEQLESQRKADAEQAKKDSESRTQQERQAKIAQATRTVEQLAKSDPKAFGFINAKGLAPNVVEYAILAHSEGNTLTLEQAAREFEANYRELRRREHAEDSSLLGDEGSTSANRGTAPATRNDRPAIPTISNRAAAAAPAPRGERERRQAAMEALSKISF